MPVVQGCGSDEAPDLDGTHIIFQIMKSSDFSENLSLMRTTTLIAVACRVSYLKVSSPSLDRVYSGVHLFRIQQHKSTTYVQSNSMGGIHTTCTVGHIDLCVSLAYMNSGDSRYQQLSCMNPAPNLINCRAGIVS